MSLLDVLRLRNATKANFYILEWGAGSKSGGAGSNFHNSLMANKAHKLGVYGPKTQVVDP